MRSAATSARLLVTMAKSAARERAAAKAIKDNARVLLVGVLPVGVLMLVLLLLVELLI